jgi:hypothetical protein
MLSRWGKLAAAAVLVSFRAQALAALGELTLAGDALARAVDLGERAGGTRTRERAHDRPTRRARLRVAVE